MHEVLVNRLGGLSLPRKSVVRLTDRPDMTLDVYRGRKTTMQQINVACLTQRKLSLKQPFSHHNLTYYEKCATERRYKVKVARNVICNTAGS